MGLGREEHGWIPKKSGPSSRRSFLRPGLWAFHSKAACGTEQSRKALYSLQKTVWNEKSGTSDFGYLDSRAGHGWVTNRNCFGFWTSQAGRGDQFDDL